MGEIDQSSFVEQVLDSQCDQVAGDVVASALNTALEQVGPPNDTQLITFVHQANRLVDQFKLRADLNRRVVSVHGQASSVEERDKANAMIGNASRVFDSLLADVTDLAEPLLPFFQHPAKMAAVDRAMVVNVLEAMAKRIEPSSQQAGADQVAETLAGMKQLLDRGASSNVIASHHICGMVRRGMGSNFEGLSRDALHGLVAEALMAFKHVKQLSEMMSQAPDNADAFESCSLVFRAIDLKSWISRNQPLAIAIAAEEIAARLMVHIEVFGARFTVWTQKGGWVEESLAAMTAIDRAQVLADSQVCTATLKDGSSDGRQQVVLAETRVATLRDVHATWMSQLKEAADPDTWQLFETASATARSNAENPLAIVDGHHWGSPHELKARWEQGKRVTKLENEFSGLAEELAALRERVEAAKARTDAIHAQVVPVLRTERPAPAAVPVTTLVAAAGGAPTGAIEDFGAEQDGDVPPARQDASAHGAAGPVDKPAEVHGAISSGGDGGGSKGEGHGAADPVPPVSKSSGDEPGSDFNTFTTKFFNRSANILSLLLFMATVGLLCVALSIPTFGLPVWAMPAMVAVAAGAIPAILHQFTGVFSQGLKPRQEFFQVDSRKRLLLLVTGMAFAAVLSLLVVPAMPAALGLMISAAQWKALAALAFALYVPALGYLLKTVMYDGPRPDDKGYTRLRYWGKVVGASLLMVPALMFAFPTAMVWLAAKAGVVLPTAASASAYWQSLVLGAAITAAATTAVQSFGALSRAFSTYFVRNTQTRAFFSGMGALINVIWPVDAMVMLTATVVTKVSSMQVVFDSMLALSAVGGEGAVIATPSADMTDDGKPSVPRVHNGTAAGDGVIGSPTPGAASINEGNAEERQIDPDGTPALK